MLSVFRARITVARISSLLLLFTLNLPACDGWVNWIYPPFGVGQITYNYLDEVWFTWQSNYTDPGLYMYCVQESINAWVEGQYCSMFARRPILTHLSSIQPVRSFQSKETAQTSKLSICLSIAAPPAMLVSAAHPVVDARPARMVRTSSWGIPPE